MSASGERWLRIGVLQRGAIARFAHPDAYRKARNAAVAAISDSEASGCVSARIWSQ
jgi:hypothetical protein